MLRYENIEQCQREAEACRQHSATEDSEQDRMLWLTLAEAWRGLAKNITVEARRPH